MTVYTEKFGEVPTEPPKPKESSYEEKVKVFRCTVCKCNCEITLTTHTKGVGPRWCPFENDQTNLRYAKWEDRQ